METILETKTTTKVNIKSPKKYNVIFYNDDVTPFEFVEFLLSEVFNKNPQDAQKIAYNIHTQGKSIIATFSKEIADTKKYLVDQYSKKNNYPLRCEVEIN